MSLLVFLLNTVTKLAFLSGAHTVLSSLHCKSDFLKPDSLAAAFCLNAGSLDGMLLLHFHTQKREKEKNVKTQSSLVGGGEKSLCRRAQKRLLKISEQKRRRGLRLFSPICSQSS